MKKLLTLISIVLASILLTACSIPFGDGGKLEVSSDGINVDLGEGEETAEDEVEAAENDEGTEEEEDATDDGATEKEDETATTDKGAGSCGEFIEDQKANDRFIKTLLEFTPPNFPLLDCQLMDSVDESYDSRDQATIIKTWYSLPGHWSDVYDEYVDYFTDLNFKKVEKNQNPKSKRAVLGGHSVEHYLKFAISQKDSEEEEVVIVELILFKYDEPREEYQD